MKLTLILLLSVIVYIQGFAQLTISAHAGYNSTQPKNSYHGGVGIPEQSNGMGAKRGWQAGISLQKEINNWFIYSGINVSNNNFYTSARYLGRYDTSSTYHTTYLSLPLGTGYRYAFTKNFAGKLYTGIYAQMGIGGRISSTKHFCADYFPCPESAPTIVTNEDIKYNNKSGDLTRFNVGLQFGAGITLFKVAELMLVYNAGLANVLPGNAEAKLHLNTVTLNAQVNIVTLGKHK